MTNGQSLTPMEEFEMKLERALKDTETRGMLIGMKRGIEFCSKRVAKDMLLKLKLDIGIVKKATKLPKAELKKILADGPNYHNYFTDWRIPSDPH